MPRRGEAPARLRLRRAMPRPYKLRRYRLVCRAEQSSRNDLRLDFGGALEDAEDAGVAENARNRELKREAVSPMDLHRIVGRTPGDPRREQLGHPRLQIAAL